MSGPHISSACAVPHITVISSASLPPAPLPSCPSAGAPSPPPPPPVPPAPCSTRSIPQPLLGSYSSSNPPIQSKQKIDSGISKLYPATLRDLKIDQAIEKSPLEMIVESIDRYVKFNPEFTRSEFEVYNIPTHPQIQEGPQCGIVALCMAATLIQPQAGCRTPSTNPDELMQTARDMGYSLQGEMFSAKNMCQLARSLLGEDNVCVEPVSAIEHEGVCESLLGGSVFLVPYDCDFNHGPCLAEGRKAHWGLITGFLLINPENSEKLSEAKPNIILMNNKEALQRIDDKKVLLIGRQSKSLVLGIWDKEELAKSNKNLRIIDPKRNSNEYVIPEGGIIEGLSNQIIKIKVKQQ